MTNSELLYFIQGQLRTELEKNESSTATTIALKYSTSVCEDGDAYHSTYSTLRDRNPFVRAERKEDGVIGWLTYRMYPFMVWGFTPESQLEAV